MAYTRTSIVSLAGMLLGHKPIQTLDNADDLIISINQAFDVLLPSVLSTGNWRFSKTIVQLSLSPQVPPVNTGWQNIYYLPSDYLQNIRIIPNNYDYEIYANNLIYSNWGTSSPVYMEYSFLVPVNQLPASFVQYFIYELAAFVALSSAQKPEYYDKLEPKRISQWAIASASDAQNRPQSNQVNIPVLDNRYITGIIGPQIG